MKRISYIFAICSCISILNSFQIQAKDFIWPGGSSIAISLSYDDSLDSQLDNAIPALDKHNMKASFYLLPNSLVMSKRMKEWASVAKDGHELGNHTIYHPCKRSLPNREWVKPYHDLDKYTVEQIIEEVTTANTFLLAIDGKTDRTFTPPCGDLMVNNEMYLNKIKDQFVAIKGQGIASGFSVLWSPSALSGKELIDYVKNVPKDVSLVNILFHGIGGDHLSVSSEAHAELLNFLSINSKNYYVDSYVNIMKYKNQQEK